MSDAPAKGSPTDDALWFLAMLAILVGLWYFAGGPGKADLKGLFLSAPEPLGTGEAYGPGTEATTTPDTIIEAPPSLPAN